MEEANNQIALLLSQTFNPDANVVRTAADALDSLSSSTLPNFPFCLLSIIAAGGEDQGLKVAAATYLKNFIRRNTDIDDGAENPMIGKDFKDSLMSTLLKSEPAVLKILIEAFRAIVAVDFVKINLWPELVSDLRDAIRSSDLIDGIGNSEWKTVNALSALHSLIRPFQYFLNPKLVKEPVPAQLELIAREILVPLLAFFHEIVKKAVSATETWQLETEKGILIICKCIYFAVRSHMPSALAPSLPSLCGDLFAILSSLSFDVGETPTDSQFLRLKTGKRSLQIFCALVTRHRKFSDKLIPDIFGCVSKIVKHSAVVSKLDFLSERIISLAFDVISRALETGPGWRLASPHFSDLLDSSIFPALVMNEKDAAEWEEDVDEYIRKNLPTELEEISGWREDLFTARKSALNLLGVIAISKGPPIAISSVSSKRKKGEKNRRKDYRSMGELLVLPFLSKFPIPANVGSTTAVNVYYGVLMAYSSLLEFLKEQSSGFTTTLIQNRLLPLYKTPYFQPYLVASANWVLGELASCIPEEMSADIYSSLMKALTTPDIGGISCYPVRVSAAGAIAQLVENDYMPPEWLPLLQVIASRVSDEEESAIMFQLLGKLVEAGNEDLAPYIPQVVSLLVETISKCIPPIPEPWPQMVESGFATLAVMAQCWEEAVLEEIEKNGSIERRASGQQSVKKAFSDLLQCAWLSISLEMENVVAVSTPSPSCIDDSSTLLGFIMKDIETNAIQNMRVSDLLLVWSNLISDWHAWEEAEDISIFSCIKEAISLNNKFSLKNFIVGEMPSPPAPPVPRQSIVEGIGAFVVEAFSQYPSAVWRASSCVHMLLHVPCHTYEREEIKQSLVLAFTEAAILRFKEIRSKPCSLWKPLLLAISSCYLCCPDRVEKVLLKVEHDGFTVFASMLSFILTEQFEHSLSTASEIKLAVLALVKIVEQLPRLGNQEIVLLKDCLISLMEASLKLLELQRNEEEAPEDDDDDDEEEEEEESDDDDDEDSEEEVHEETEEEFLKRCAETASALENGTLVEEGDIDDQDGEIELGALGEVDVQRTVFSLIERYHPIFQQGGPLPAEIVSNFLSAFPECSRYFQ